MTRRDRFCVAAALLGVLAGCDPARPAGTDDGGTDAGVGGGGSTAGGSGGGSAGGSAGAGGGGSAGAGGGSAGGSDAGSIPPTLVPDCAVLKASTLTALPPKSGTLPGSSDMTTAGGSQYLYVLTQWGFARGGLTNPANPGPYNEIVLGADYLGSGGTVPIIGDCHQGSNTMAIAQGPGGSARLISDWQPFRQCGGFEAELAQATGTGSIVFGQQLHLTADVPLGSRIAAVYLSSSQKYLGYFPTSGDFVDVVDLTSPTGNASPTLPLNGTHAISWSSQGTGTTVAVRLAAAHVTTPTYEHDLLAGTTATDKRLHLAEINGATGALSEVASTTLTSIPNQVELAVVDGRIFIFSAELSAGLRVYEFQPPGTVVFVGAISGMARTVAVRGPGPFPALLLHRMVNGSTTFIDLYDTYWLTKGSSPVLIKSLPHFGAPGGAYHGYGFEALVTRNGTALTAYLYRETSGFPVSSLHTDTIDLSCLQ